MKVFAAFLFASVLAGFVWSQYEASYREQPDATAWVPPHLRTNAVGYWSYRVYGTEWRDSILNQKADATFLVIDLAVRNNDNSASMLPPLHLVDDEGREYDESGASIFLEPSLIFKHLNPTVTSRGYAAFDVPQGHYRLKVSGGFQSGGKSETIDLH